MPGTVQVVGTGDRGSRKLLGHYGIAKPVVSYHQHNEAEQTPEPIGRLPAGSAGGGGGPSGLARHPGHASL